jgi:hypothetical protein
MSAGLIKAAIAKAAVWVAKRGKGVSKHVSHHTHSAANAARRNPRYLARVLGRKRHTVFRDPRPKKLIEAALQKPSATVLRPNGLVWVERQFNRVIGKEGETIIRIWIDPRTGRVITAFPVAKTFAAAGVAVTLPSTAFGEVLEERVETALEGLEEIASAWQRSHHKPLEDAGVRILEFVLSVIGLDSEIAGDPEEGLQIKLENYLDQQASALISELERGAGQTFGDSRRQALRKEFRDAVAGAIIDPEEEE